MSACVQSFPTQEPVYQPGALACCVSPCEVEARTKKMNPVLCRMWFLRDRQMCVFVYSKSVYARSKFSLGLVPRIPCTFSCKVLNKWAACRIWLYQSSRMHAT
jgi:hypothetical protein